MNIKLDFRAQHDYNYDYMTFIERKNYKNIHLRCTQGEIRFTKMTMNILQGLCTHTKINMGNIKTND